MINKILAVVVTYNRLELLKRCFEALKKQTYKDFDILIVNNGSTDGTKEWIDSLPGTILRINQENLGGAGGFYAGQKYSYDNGYEWIWMMDDDGVPDKNQLKELLRVAQLTDSKITGPVVINIENKQEQAFYPGEGLNFIGKEYYSYNTKYVCPFNGILFNKEVLSTVGFIKRELFIWGDEREYTLRWRKNGYKEVAALKAYHYHPAIRSIYDNVFWGINKYKVVIKSKKFTKFYYRNNAYINKHYGTLKVTIGEFILYCFYFIRKFDMRELSKFVTSYFSGLRLK